MSYILINDIFDELREENNRLFIENEEIIDLLSKYRNISLNFHKFCVCNQNSNNNFVIKSLEEEYQKFSNQRITKSIKSETIDESLEKTTKDKKTRHIKSRHKLVSNKCDFKNCRKRFISTIALEKHKKIVHQKEYIPCDYPGCGQTFKSLLGSQRHQKELHSDHRLTCEWPGCGKTYPTSQLYRFRNHRTQHNLENEAPGEAEGSSHLNSRKLLHPKKFKCSWPNCEEAYPESILLVGHINNKHKNVRPFKCTFEGCLKAFHNLRYLKNHKKKMHSIKRLKLMEPTVHKCGECCFESKLGSRLKAHITKKHSNQEKTVECTFDGCSIKFISDERMRIHLNKVHIKEKFRCDWPGCEFYTHCQLTIDNHKRYHIGRRDFKCDFEGCLKDFITQKTLDQHRRTHLKRFMCSWPECEQRFSEEVYLTAHMNRHLNLRPFKCSFNNCNKDFKIDRHLKHHIRTVHKIKPKDLL